MSKLDRLSLLNFLDRPRYSHEVAEHFKVSIEVANYNLQEVAKLGKILVSESRVSPGFLGFHHQLEGFKDFLYVSKSSPLVVANVLKLTTQEINTSKSKTRASSIKFLPKSSMAEETPLMPGSHMYILSKKLESSQKAATRFMPRRQPTKKISNRFTSQMRLTKENKGRLRTPHGKFSTKRENRSLSHNSKLHLLQALSHEPLPFLDLRRQFGVSKRVVEGYVKRGFLEEKWGPSDVGIKFGLTKKGRDQLRQVEAAAHLKPQQQKNIFIRLKHGIHP